MAGCKIFVQKNVQIFYNQTKHIEAITSFSYPIESKSPMVDANILVVDDNKSVLSALEILLQFEYKSVQTIFNPNQISSFPKLEDIDIVLLDMNFSAGVNTGNEGLYWLNEIKKRSPNTSVIMMTAYGAVDLAVRALKQGASDFVLKPWNNERLMTTVKSAYELRKSKQEIHNLKKKENNLKQVINEGRNYIIGQSKALTSVLNLVAKVAKTDVNVLITGENGTGKELIARELHRLSTRKEEVFIPVDMGLICATNCNLEQMVSDGLFREDLLYRINTIHIEVPPLRERDEDILVLADFFLKKFAHKYDKSGLRINQLAQEKLMEYPWPGNIRELQHTMERAVILSDGTVLKPSDFLLHAKPMQSLDNEPMIYRALEQNEGNYSAAAEQLGISRQTLYNKLKKKNH